MQKMAKLHVLNNNREIEGQKEQKKIIKTQVYIYIYIHNRQPNNKYKTKCIYFYLYKRKKN